MRQQLHIIAYAALGKGLSGSDNILIELSRRWADKLNITIYGGEQIKLAADKKNLTKVKFNICPSKTPFHYIERLFNSLKTAYTFKKVSTIYTASDFPHDLLVGWIIKLRFPSIRWIAGYYLVAPPPFSGCSPYRGVARIRGIGYWLMQRFTLWIVNKWADVVYITSEPDWQYFPFKKVVIIKGGVNLPKTKPVSYELRDYAAVFMGRFHYQKGVMELVDIWNKVLKTKPNAKLLMIGNGVLRDKCVKKVINLGILKSIDFKPFADEQTKEYWFRRSKIVVHPATYDSGGMSAAEAMAYSLPCVGFDLEVYKTYYARGMIKTKNKKEFAKEIIKLLTNRKYYNHWSKEAYEYIKEEWDWDKRADKVYNETNFNRWGGWVGSA